jgi:hypothetical protein
MTVELTLPAEAFESKTGSSGNPTASVASELPEENLIARCRYKRVLRRRSRIVRRGPFTFRGRRFGRRFVLRRTTTRRVRVRVCH